MTYLLIQKLILIATHLTWGLMREDVTQPSADRAWMHLTRLGRFC